MAKRDFNTTIYPLPTNRKVNDLTGQTFGRLTVLGYGKRTNMSTSKWVCECECGTKLSVGASALREGTRSCGCLSRDFPSGLKHGGSRGGRVSVEYTAYQSAKSRCRQPKNASYARYGGRGIEFRFNSFSEFFKEIGERPSPSHSVERINTDGHYEPGNIRWATIIEQANNMSTNRLLTVNGVTKTASQWARENTISLSGLYNRLDRGYCTPCAVLLPLRAHCLHKSNGVLKSQS